MKDIEREGEGGREGGGEGGREGGRGRGREGGEREGGREREREGGREGEGIIINIQTIMPRSLLLLQFFAQHESFLYI